MWTPALGRLEEKKVIDKMTEMIDVFNQNPWVIFLCFCITILGLILAIAFFYASRKKKDFRYSYNSNQLIKDFKILDSNIIFTKNDINNVKCELINNEEVLLMFDYLDKGEGFVVQLIHTSPNNKDLYVDGTIKGIGDISKRIIHFEPAYIRFLDKRLSKTGNDRTKDQIALKVMGWLTIFLGIVFLIYSVMVLIKGNMKSVDIIMLFICSILYFIIGIPLVRSSVPIYFKNFYERIR